MHDDKYKDSIELFDRHLDEFVEDDEVIVFDDVEPSLSRKQNSFPELTLLLRTDFRTIFESPLQGRY